MPHRAESERLPQGLAAPPPGSSLEVFRAFLKLGVTSFGGPVAHLGYFHREFVARRKWLDEPAYSSLVALCQLLPGPTSSQVGFSIGLLRAGYAGALAAWAAFTVPSAIVLVLFAYGATALARATSLGLIHGLKLVAVAIVAQAVWSMARSSCADRKRASVAFAAGLLILVTQSSLGQLVAIAAGGLLGFVFCRNRTTASAMVMPSLPVTRRVSLLALTFFFVLLIGLPVARRLAGSGSVVLLEAFYRSGALVFGGGHVVLPLLRQAFVAPGWVSDDAFLSGYGAAQAIPGPLFAFAAYLGAVNTVGPHGVAGAALGLLAIFLPGLLVLLAMPPFVAAFRKAHGAQAVVAGINAAVVGLLAAALYNPIGTSAIRTPVDLAVALCGVSLLTVARAPALLVVALLAVAGMTIAHP
jgi:chromate transporter